MAAIRYNSQITSEDLHQRARHPFGIQQQQQHKIRQEIGPVVSRNLEATLISSRDSMTTRVCYEKTEDRECQPEKVTVNGTKEENAEETEDVEDRVKRVGLIKVEKMLRAEINRCRDEDTTKSCYVTASTSPGSIDRTDLGSGESPLRSGAGKTSFCIDALLGRPVGGCVGSIGRLNDTRERRGRSAEHEVEFSDKPAVKRLEVDNDNEDDEDPRAYRRRVKPTYSITGLDSDSRSYRRLYRDDQQHQFDIDNTRAETRVLPGNLAPPLPPPMSHPTSASYERDAVPQMRYLAARYRDSRIRNHRDDRDDDEDPDSMVDIDVDVDVDVDVEENGFPNDEARRNMRNNQSSRGMHSASPGSNPGGSPSPASSPPISPGSEDHQNNIPGCNGMNSDSAASVNATAMAIANATVQHHQQHGQHQPIHISSGNYVGTLGGPMSVATNAVLRQNQSLLLHPGAGAALIHPGGLYYHPGATSAGGGGAGSAFHSIHKEGQAGGHPQTGPGASAGHPQQHHIHPLQLEWLARTGMLYPRLPADLAG